MKINSFKYSEMIPGTTEKWDIFVSDFKNLNLITGKNSTGKSRLVSMISRFSNILLNSDALFNGAFEVEIEIDSLRHNINITFENGSIIKESIFVNNERKLSRESLTGEIFYDSISNFLPFEAQANTSIIALRNDPTQHSFISKIIQWAKNVTYIEFNREVKEYYPFNTFDQLINSHNNQQSDNPSHNSTLVTYATGFSKFGHDFDNMIKTDMASLDYPLEDIGAEDLRPTFLGDLSKSEPLIGIFVQEKNANYKLPNIVLSAGMMRVLNLIIRLNLAILTGHNLFIVDDIGEGLDYSRSRKIIDLIIKKQKDSNIQVVLTTNDKFAMNSVPLESWIFLTRDVSHVKVMTSKTDPEKFKEFEYTGLNNFDFFSIETGDM